jgi:hypothetical protein
MIVYSSPYDVPEFGPPGESFQVIFAKRTHMGSWVARVGTLIESRFRLSDGRPDCRSWNYVDMRSRLYSEPALSANRISGVLE